MRPRIADITTTTSCRAQRQRPSCRRVFTSSVAVDELINDVVDDGFHHPIYSDTDSLPDLDAAPLTNTGEEEIIVIEEDNEDMCGVCYDRCTVLTDCLHKFCLQCCVGVCILSNSGEICPLFCLLCKTPVRNLYAINGVQRIDNEIVDALDNGELLFNQF